MTLFDSTAYEDHEAVHAFHDERTGLKAIIAIHSTARGPSAGGCRMWNYGTSQAAMDDALRLSRAMSYKNAMADLELGGGKAVIMGDARRDKTPALFAALGRFIESLNGRYWTAEDVGVDPADLAFTREQTRFVAGLENHPAASGDPSPITAEGVFRCTELAVRRALGRELKDVTVAIQGVGSVGGALAQKLAAAGARLIITDINQDMARDVGQRTGARVVKPEAIFDADADVFAPCALGAVLNEDTVPRLRARVICGGANNPLGYLGVGQYLHDKGVLYAPDYVVNAGGIINVAAEIRAIERTEPYDPAWVEGKLQRVVQTLDEVLDRAEAERRPPHLIADEVARARIKTARA